MRKIAIFLLIGVGLGVGAGIFVCVLRFRAKRAPKVDHIEIALEVQRMEQQIAVCTSKEQLATLLYKNDLFTKRFLMRGHPQPLERWVEKLWDMIQHPDIKRLYEETQRVFGNFEPFRRQLQEAFRYIKFYYPDFVPPKVMTCITGMGTDLYIDRELIVLGLDFFLGEKATFRPLGVPTYILRTYQPEYLIPKVLLLISRWFNDTDENDRTMLADMIYYGKAYVFVQAVSPRTDIEYITGDTVQQQQYLYDNQEAIWGHFIENSLLYITTQEIKASYVEERPSTPEIAQGCPGKVGRWLGWQIVKAYAKRNPSLPLSGLMATTKAQDILLQSRYTPVAP